MWKVIKDSILEAASSNIGLTLACNRKPWFDEECLTALYRRTEARRRALDKSSRSAAAVYKEVRSQTQKLIRRKKRLFLRQQLEEIEALQQMREIRAFYRAVASKSKT